MVGWKKGDETAEEKECGRRRTTIAQCHKSRGREGSFKKEKLVRDFEY